MSEQKNEQPVDDDTQSDPAHEPQEGWAAEGGAADEGPATDTDAADA